MKKIISTLAAIAMLTSTVTSINANAYTNDYEDIFEPDTTFVTLGAKPAQVKVKKAYTSGTKAVKINWNKVKNATGYRVYRYNGKKWVKVANTRKTAYKVIGLKAGKQYKFKVKAFKRTSEGTVWGKASAVKLTATKPNTPTFAAAAATQDTIKLRWNRVNCDGYQVYQKIDDKYTKIATVKGADNVTYKIENLDASTKYSFKVRAYKRDGAAKNLFSSFSDKNKTTDGLYWSPIMKAWYNCMICEATDKQIKMVEHDMTQATIDACNGKTEFEYEYECYGEVEHEIIYAAEPVNWIEDTTLSFENNNAHLNLNVPYGIGNDCWLEKKTHSDKYKMTEQERYDCVVEFRNSKLTHCYDVPLDYNYERENPNGTIPGGTERIYWSMYKNNADEWALWFCNDGE